MSQEQRPEAGKAGAGDKATADFDLDRDRPDACGHCPLARIPPPVWRRLLHPPFHQRHPLICAFAILMLALASLGALAAAGREGLFGPSERLALISLRGVISDVGPQLDWIRKVREDRSIKGALLRVDSPGGGAAASQELYLALKNLAAEKPLVVSMGATAASGGLMAAMAGERIFANPSTVTGSIGVRMDIPQVQDLMRKIGVGQETLVTAPFKDAASWTHPLTATDRAYLESVIMDMHRQFVGIVAAGRHMSEEQAARLANGKIYTGQEALALGLVDELGGQEAALAWLAAKSGVPASRALKKPRRPSSGLWRNLEKLGALACYLLDAESGSWSDLAAPAFLYR